MSVGQSTVREGAGVGRGARGHVTGERGRAGVAPMLHRCTSAAATE